MICTAIDGDTLRCPEIGRVRLLGIDAPELPGHCRRGRTCTPGDPVASKKALEKLAARGVTISPVTRDWYARTVAQVYAGNKNLASEQLRGDRAVYIEKWDNAQRLAKECRYARRRGS